MPMPHFTQSYCVCQIQFRLNYEDTRFHFLPVRLFRCHPKDRQEFNCGFEFDDFASFQIHVDACAGYLHHPWGFRLTSGWFSLAGQPNPEIAREKGIEK